MAGGVSLSVAELASRRKKIVIGLLLVVQVSVPLVATSRGVPSQLGFHMFTGHEGMSVSVLDAHGDEVDVDLADWIVTQREDVDLGPRLAPAICRSTPAAAEVIVRQRGVDGVFPC